VDFRDGKYIAREVKTAHGPPGTIENEKENKDFFYACRNFLFFIPIFLAAQPNPSTSGTNADQN